MKESIARSATGLLLFLLLLQPACAPRSVPPPVPATHDVLIRGGTLYDGSGGPPRQGDVALVGDTIAAVGDLRWARGRLEVDARGLAVAPGFVNVLSWANESLIEDGRSQSDIRQGVTVEVMGEGWSMGPLNAAMKRELVELQGDIRYEVTWTSLGEYLDHLADRGVSTNVASFVGATTVRVHVLGYEDRAPTPSELERMRELVRQAMEEGALGLASSLIYAPGSYADTDELVELASAAGEYGGIYVSHLRSEGDRLLEGVDELISIARDAGTPAEIYHLKAAGEANWPKLEAAIAKVEAARASGLPITADMYTYTAGATGLDASMPPWVQEGGHRAWVERLKQPAVRERVRSEMAAPGADWENLYQAAGSPERILLVGFKSDSLKPLTGRTLAEVAAMRGTSPEETAIDLVVQDDSRVEAVYFLMSEENVRRQVALPWMSFGSDAASVAPEGVFLRSNPHPRAYGNFARLLGRYVRDERVIPLEEAVRRLTSLPAANLRLDRRGALQPGYFADVVVFDPAEVRDNATFTDPHRYSTGVVHVFVNGVQVLREGEHTGARPGRVVRGPGRRTRTAAGAAAPAATPSGGPEGAVPEGAGAEAAPLARTPPTAALPEEPARETGRVAAPPAVTRTPVLPWPFFGRRSLAALGPRGIVALRPGSPEHRLLVQLDSRECGGGAPVDACLFLEAGRVYAIRREPGSEPPRFILERVPIAVPGGGGLATERYRLDLSDPERPYLLSLPAPAGAPPAPGEGGP